jgi:AAA15 family ATPase/GTPase
MKLKSLKIENYRSCRNTNLSFNDELTCLIGINGSGKSNILNAILLLRKLINSSAISNNQIDTFKNTCKIFVELEYNNKTLYIRGDISFGTDEYNVDYIQFSSLSWNFKDFINNQLWFKLPQYVFDIDFLQMIKSKSSSNDFINSRFEKLLNSVDDKEYKTILKILESVYNFFNGINYYSASIFTDPSKCPVSIEFDEKKPTRRIISAQRHDKFIIDLYNVFKENGIEYKRFLSIINKSGIGLIENIDFKEVSLPSSTLDVKSVGNMEVKENKRLLVIPSFRVDGIDLSPNQLSEGTFKTLSLIFYILTDKSKLLLIEEPEVCVHHGLLNSLIELIKSQSKHKQIIISTHSDFVLDHLSPENIVLVEHNGVNGTTAKSLTNSMTKNEYKALKSYLEESGNLGDYWIEGGFDNDK